MGVLTELKNRGIEDILTACMDGLTGVPHAVKADYSAESEEAGQDELEPFNEKWKSKYTMIYKSCDFHSISRLSRLLLFYAFIQFNIFFVLDQNMISKPAFEFICYGHGNNRLIVDDFISEIFYFFPYLFMQFFLFV
jgi:hypothetical protein